MSTSIRILLTLVLVLAAGATRAASVEKAEMLSAHGLQADAKRELIDVVFGPDPKQKPQALYLLGSIEFRENEVTAAVQAWRELVTRFPKSEQAALVTVRLKQLTETVASLSKSGTDNAVAQAYLSHGDFWTSRKAERFRIDSSWLPHVEMATAWYDRVLVEFPTSGAARTAYEQKLRAVLGWREGRDEAEGLEADFGKYMPLVLATFEAFERDFPEASSLQAFRFQIAQGYWSHRRWADARKWLEVIVEKAGSEPSFYRDLAERRLQKLEF